MSDVKKKILIVDDEPNIRELFTNALSSYGFDCLQAKNGLEGLNLCLTANPDIVLLDVRMPEMDGIAMLQELRKKEVGKKMPVIVFSTLNDEKSISDALRLGVSDFLEKSNLNMAELAERIHSHIDIK